MIIKDVIVVEGDGDVGDAIGIVCGDNYGDACDSIDDADDSGTVNLIDKCDGIGDAIVFNCDCVIGDPIDENEAVGNGAADDGSAGGDNGTDDVRDDSTLLVERCCLIF